jgi:voltage-gated potassium channel
VTTLADMVAERSLRSRLARVRAGEGYERWERRTDVPLMLLALVFVVVLLVPVVHPDQPPALRLALDLLNVTIWAVFAVDYLVRLYLARERWLFVRRNVLDLVVIAVPMLRPLRVLRGARAVRLFRVVRLGALAGRTGRTARHALHVRATTYVAGGATLLLFIAAAGMVGAERSHPEANIQTFGDALWWAMTTVTTVGYGDRYPVTPEGRLVATFLMVVGIALLGFLTAAVAAWFVSQLTANREQVTEAVNVESQAVLSAIGELSERLSAVERAMINQAKQ